MPGPAHDVIPFRSKCGNWGVSLGVSHKFSSLPASGESCGWFRVTPCEHSRQCRLSSPVLRVRLKSGLSQAQFAAALGSKRTLEQWEQGRRQPSGAANRLLKIAECHPEVLIEVAA